MYSKIHAVVCISLKKTFMGGGKGKNKTTPNNLFLKRFPPLFLGNFFMSPLI